VNGRRRGHLIYKNRTVFLKYHRLLDGAHRHPPNSLSALRQVLADGAEAIEFDVRLTRDDVFVLVHDPTLERETTGGGPVRAMTVRELARLRLRDADEPPATLAGVVDVLRGHRAPVKVQVDLVEEAPLSEDSAKGLIDVLAPLRANANVRTVIGCEAAEKLLTLRRLDPALRVGLDVEAPIEAPAGEVSRRLNLVEDVSEFYMPRAFVVQTVARGFNPIEFVHERKPGALVDVWTLYADEPDIGRTLSTVLEAGADQITTPAAANLIDVFKRLA